MKLQADLFPYPVLSKELDDYVNSEFKVEIFDQVISPTKVQITFIFSINNKIIENLLKEGSAVFAIHIEGIGSSYRKLITVPTGESSLSIILSAEEVRTKLEINKMIIANNTIENYHNPDFNALYYGNNFSVSKMNKGEIIAFDSMSILTIDFDNLESNNYQSMIRVAAKDDQYMSVDIESDFILIHLPKKAYEIYVTLSQNKKEYEQLFLITVIQPALMYVIERIGRDYIDETLKWYDSLINLLNKIGYDINTVKNADSLIVSQKLLDLPVEKSFIDFYEMGDNDDE